MQIDNQRLVVSREIATVQSLRRFQASAIELSLFFRALQKAEPIIAERNRVPKGCPPPPSLDDSQLTADIAMAAIFRPEIRRIELLVEKSRN